MSDNNIPKAITDKDIENSNQEMNDLGRISEKNKDGYSDKVLNSIIADIKKQLTDIKQITQQ